MKNKNLNNDGLSYVDYELEKFVIVFSYLFIILISCWPISSYIKTPFVILPILGFIVATCYYVLLFCILIKNKHKCSYFTYAIIFLIIHLMVTTIFCAIANIINMGYENSFFYSIIPIIINYSIYDVFNLYLGLKELTKDKFISIFTLVTLFIITFSLLAFAIVHSKWSIALLKVGVGFVYFITITTILNAYLYKQQSYFNKKITQSFFYKFLIVVFLIGIICTFQLYVSWFNLNDKAFEYFVTIYSALIGGLLTLGGVAWTIKYEKEEKQREEQQKLLQTCPILSFYQFDSIYYDDSNCDSIPHPNWLLINKKTSKKVKSIVVKLSFKNSNSSLIKQININEFSIIVKNKVDKIYKFSSDITDERINVGVIDNNLYQVTINLLADEKILKDIFNNINEQEISDNVTFVMDYTCLNVYSVGYKGHLSVATFAITQNEEIRAESIQDITNWSISEPQIYKKQQE